MSKPSNSKILSLDSILTFGKYKNFTLRDVITHDADYINWAVTEKIIELDNIAYKFYSQHYIEKEDTGEWLGWEGYGMMPE